ncbi:type VII toxin-antitoxin system HepT family RNase toxin [Pyrodictium abyssi]|uniref:DUF86 domain-containing protein n=1 Tax=Pyrodictium abyssi TaxID=54256 RepID=A0ABM8J0L3_9CREN|nr:hypothetical protein PABY_19570 [Pyrodictium abyssi]
MGVCGSLGSRLSPEEVEAIRRYLADAREALDQLRFLAGLPAEEVARDKTLRYSLRYAIILLVEASVDAAVALLEKLFEQPPSSYRESFLRLIEAGVIPARVGEEMARLAALRNAIIHRYWFIDDLRALNEAARGGIKAVEEFLHRLEECIEEAARGEAATTQYAP